jgi:hypothetical protein
MMQAAMLATDMIACRPTATDTCRHQSQLMHKAFIYMKCDENLIVRRSIIQYRYTCFSYPQRLCLPMDINLIGAKVDINLPQLQSLFSNSLSTNASRMQVNLSE